MAKIADDLNRALQQRIRSGGKGTATGRVLAEGKGWSVHDVICTSGPADRTFEERHSRVSIALVAAGSFQYRSTSGGTLLTPGSILLGNAGHCFECGHDHAAGDRCIAFNIAPELFERVAADAGAGSAARRFSIPALPATKETSGIAVRSAAALLGANDSWDEIAVSMAATVARVSLRGRSGRPDAPRTAVRRVTEVVREMERGSATSLSLAQLAGVAGLSQFHFLRTFQQVVGTTPHQYLRRLRLRDAASRIALHRGRIIDAIYDSGFGDVSNFNRAFKSEFGVNPRRYRARSTAA